VDIAAGVAGNATTTPNAEAAQLSRTYDTVAPTVSITSAEADPTRNAAIAVTITTSESTTTLTADDLEIFNGSISGFSGSGTSYAVTFVPAVQGAAGFEIAAGAFTDAAGNGNTGPTSFSRTYDSIPPPIPTAPTCTGSENSVAVSWTTGGGDTAGYLVVRRYGSAPTWTPVDGTAYSTATTNNLDDYTHWLAYADASTSTTEVDVFPGMPHEYASMPTTQPTTINPRSPRVARPRPWSCWRTSPR
jgi:Bacterial Ig-like domain